MDELGIAPGATPNVIERDGVRMGFATCFDFYFPEHFEALAGRRADIVLCSSYQRSESAERILLIARARALDSGTYVIRCSYAMGTPSVGGHSLVAAPDGSVVADAGEKPCVLPVEIDPKRKFMKPASHGQRMVEHRSLVESHRCPAASGER